MPYTWHGETKLIRYVLKNNFGAHKLTFSSIFQAGNLSATTCGKRPATYFNGTRKPKRERLKRHHFFIAICRERLKRHHYEKVFRSKIIRVTRTRSEYIPSYTPDFPTICVLLILSRNHKDGDSCYPFTNVSQQACDRWE